MFWKAEAGGSLEPRSLSAAWATHKTSVSTTTTTTTTLKKEKMMRRGRVGLGRGAPCEPDVRPAGAAGLGLLAAARACANQKPDQRLPLGTHLVGTAAAELGWPLGLSGHGEHSGEAPEPGGSPGRGPGAIQRVLVQRGPTCGAGRAELCRSHRRGIFPHVHVQELRYCPGHLWPGE